MDRYYFYLMTYIAQLTRLQTSKLMITFGLFVVLFRKQIATTLYNLEGSFMIVQEQSEGYIDHFR